MICGVYSQRCKSGQPPRAADQGEGTGELWAAPSEMGWFSERDVRSLCGLSPQSRA